MHPRIASQWEDLLPGSADRLLKLTEISVRGRRDVAKRLSRAEALAVIVGAISLPLVAAGGIAASVVLILNGYDGAALLTATPGIIYGVGAGFGAWRKGSTNPED